MYNKRYLLSKTKVAVNSAKGFTLLELIVVMAVIGGLAGIIISNFPAGRERARDTHRRSDLKQYQTAIETFANKQGGLYPVRNLTWVKPSSFCVAGQPLDGYQSCPVDPRDTEPDCSSVTCEYKYLSNNTGSEYTIWAALERPAERTDFWFIVCSTGITYESATEPSGANLCP